MQTKDTEEFDLEIRSLLEDAEVKPSRRVWRGVRAGLRQQEEASRAWMRWAGVCAAAFAAIALGVFLFPSGPDGGIAGSPEIYSQLIPAQETAQTVEETAAPRPEMPLAAPAASPSAHVGAPVPAAALENAPAAPAADPSAPLAGGNSVPAGEATQPSVPADLPASPAEQSAASPKESTAGREYVPIEWKAEKSGRKPVQLYAQGSLLGNESDFSFRRGRAYGSSGVSTSKTGVSELGESSCGIPFSVGLGVRFYVLPKLAIGTGLDYSFLTRGFNGRYVNTSLGIDETGSVTHDMHYLGIPLNVSYDFVSTKRIKAYAQLGGEAEYCLSNKYNITAGGGVYDYSSAVKGLQWSIGAGVGVEFLFTPWLGIYLDPGIRYYFDCNQPKSVRTEKPVMVNFDAGLRFNF